MRILRLNALTKLTGLSRTTLWRLERAGEFHNRIRLSKNSVGWDESDVARWLASRPRGLAPHRTARTAGMSKRLPLEKVQ